MLKTHDLFAVALTIFVSRIGHQRFFVLGCAPLNLGRYDIITTDVSKFVVVYAILYLAYFFALQTVHRSYENHFQESAMLQGNTDTDTCKSIVQSIADSGFRLFSLTFGDSLLDTVHLGMSGPSNACGGLQVYKSNL